MPSLCRPARRRSLLHGEEGQKRRIVLFCWMDNCNLMEGAMSPLPTVSLWEHCPAQALRASKSPVPALRKTPPFQSFSRGNALPALLGFLRWFVGAELQMAAHYKCTRKGVFWNGLWLQCWVENPPSAVGEFKEPGVSLWQPGLTPQ